MNRVTAVATPGGTADLTYTYAPDGLVTQVTANNPGNATVTTTYAYYKRRLLQQETVSQPSASFTLGYGYTGNGHLSTLTYPDNQVVAYAPNALGQPTKVGTYATGVTYYPNGAIKQFSYGNGVLHTMTQNARRLPARSEDKKGATVVLDDSYDFDANGNVTDITDQAQAGLTTRGMAYDGLDRLTIAVAPNLWGNATYGYDALDNLRSADQGTRQYRYVYDAQLRLSQINNPAGTPQITLGYDVRGNVTSKNSQAFVFDASNRLNQVTGQETYRYDGQGRRVQATMPDTKSMFWQYSQAGQVTYVSDTRRSRNTAYMYLGNTQVAIRHEAWGTGAVTVSYQHTDALGSPVAETDAGGVVTKRNTYAPYGEAYNSSIDGPGYTGHVMDQATGLTYMQQRYYDPAIGRFLSVDPVATNPNSGANFNSYWYANNNPFMFTDPDGREAQRRPDPQSLCDEVHPCEVGSFGPSFTSITRSNQSDQSGKGQATGTVTTGAIQPVPSGGTAQPVPMWCDSRADCGELTAQNEYLTGKITKEELDAFYQARGNGALIGGSIVVGGTGVIDPAK